MIFKQVGPSGLGHCTVPCTHHVYSSSVHCGKYNLYYYKYSVFNLFLTKTLSFSMHTLCYFITLYVSNCHYPNERFET